MSSDQFTHLKSTLDSQGAARAIDELCENLRDAGDFNSLFYALLMKKRHEMGVLPVPTGPSSDLPDAAQHDYEEAIRAAARDVGQRYLAAGQIPQAWVYFRMIDEPAPVRAALEAANPGDDEDVGPLISIAFYEGVHPEKGFAWVLQRNGLCNAITTVGGGEVPHPEPVKQHCVRALVRALHAELRDRLAFAVEHHTGAAPAGAAGPPEGAGAVRGLIQGRDWLFAEDAYHIDTSHLSSVVQMAMTLAPCPEIGLARELCAYGARLTGRFLGSDDPPFEGGYADYDVYLAVLDGDAVEEGLAHFRRKADAADPNEVGTYPAEVLVNLLVRIGRGREAIAVARKHLAGAERQGRPLTCPNLNELCQRFGAFDVLAEVARERGDAVHYLAGLLAGRVG